MSTSILSEIQAKIAKLEAEAAQLRGQAEAERLKQVAVMVDEIRAKIAEYGLSARDLGFSTMGVKSKRASTAKAPKAARGPVYRGPNGETWTGGTRGRKPGWITQALSEGKTLEDLAA